MDLDKRVFRVVLASPSDVQDEREAANFVVESVNRQLRDAAFAAVLELSRWETDAYPGVHALGPQGLIDERLRIEHSDILVGVFWRRFGTPVGDANSGTEHEIRRAIEAWKVSGAPQVMLYFREVPEEPTTPEEAEQIQRVCKFKQGLSLTDKTLIWEYKDPSAFSNFLHEHLWRVVMQWLGPARPASGPLSFLRVSAYSKRVCARREGMTELMADLFLHCTFDGHTPPSHTPNLIVSLSTHLPITSRIRERGVTDVVLFEVGRPGTATVIPGVIAEPGSHELIFSGVRLTNIGAHETRIFQISNLRCDCTFLPIPVEGAVYPVFAFVMITGAAIENPQHIVASVRKGLEFEARRADNLGRLEENGFEASRSTNVNERRIATLRFTEGFMDAFKSRAPTLGRAWNMCEGDAVSTGESGPICPVFADGEDGINVAGLVHNGTRLRADFSGLPAGVRIFVSTRELGYNSRSHTHLLHWEGRASPGEAMMIGDVEVRELPVENGCTAATWEVMAPLDVIRFVDFAVFASYVADSGANLPVVGTGTVQGGFTPGSHSYAPNCWSSGATPFFYSRRRTLYNVLTVTQ